MLWYVLGVLDAAELVLEAATAATAAVVPVDCELDEE